MNYYYEIKLNFDSVAYTFYETSIEDKYEFIKKIPIIKVKTETLKKIYLYDFEIDDESYKYIKGKTICKNNLDLKDACIFCDTKNCIAIEFGDNKKSISRSNLLLEDENNICEISYSLKNKNIKIKENKKVSISNEFRQEHKIKKLITTEIKNLYKRGCTNKLKYLYYEWFDKKEDNIKLIKNEMLKDINDTFKDIHIEIYNIIRLSYNNIKL